MIKRRPKPPPTLTVQETEEMWASIEALAPPQPERTGNSGNTSGWIAAVEAGEALHESTRGLAFAGWSLGELQALMNRSAARVDRPAEWTERYNNLETLVKSGQKKRYGAVCKVLSAPFTLPDDAMALTCEPSAISGGKPLDVPVLPPDELDFEVGVDIDITPTIMTLDDMVRDLVLVESSGGVVHLPTMRVRKKDMAKTTYAGSKHMWIDANGMHKESEAFKLWLEDRRRKSVDVLTWSPAMKTICYAPEQGEEGARAVNLWIGFRDHPLPEGDLSALVEPFLEHLTYLVPVDDERERFIKWLAHIAQRPGELPHTCYLMVTETTGIGRNWLTGLLAWVFRGYVANGINMDGILAGSFNGRLGRKVLATVDEAQEGMSGNRAKRENALKDVITKAERELNPKYGIPSIQYNCCRWLMLSNHLDALPFNAKDRRVIVIRNPTERRGLAYYNKMYALLHDPKFIAAVWHFLLGVDLKGFNHAEPAPMNKAKAAMLEYMENDVVAALRRFMVAWPAAVVDRTTLIGFVTDEIGHKEPHQYHFRKSLEEMGIITAARRVHVNGRKEMIYCIHADADEVDKLAPDDIRQIIGEGAAALVLNE